MRQCLRAPLPRPSKTQACHPTVIMMSQNRQQAKNRVRAEYDYRVNLKAELEIRHLIESECEGGNYDA